MTRLLALLLLAILIYWLVSALVRRLALAAGGGAEGRSRRTERPASGPSQGEPLVRCAACGVRLPESRSLAARGAGVRREVGGVVDRYCSEACRRGGGRTR